MISSQGDSIKHAKNRVKVFKKKRSKKSLNSEVTDDVMEKYNQIDPAKIRLFTDLPLSPKTLKGLKDCGYTSPTEIQRECLVLGLQGFDVLGAAQTGSGKTLAFLIPILERLFTLQWTNLDGLGALVVSPTRELALQIFETLRKVGAHHDFSAGLIIGGKDLKFERNRMGTCNIIVCTPGRLLQHMDENALFDCVNLKVLVLDEADRCLDMGFEQTMNAIIANLPFERQTLLFSATQTKSVKDLARLSLKEPKYVSVHEGAQYSTPPGLEQSYILCDLPEKISALWSFIKNHLKRKIIVFLSTCKQVKFVYEMFCKLRPGISLLALYGTLHQLRRMEIYESFCKKQSAVLFATDLVSRGLDFPEVHWVVQVDCPEDTDTYIHRVGRTARYHRGGESLLLLLHSEVAMLDELESRKIPIRKIEINPEKSRNPVRKMEAFLASTPSLKETAQRAFVAYIKSVFLLRNKNVFQVDKLDTAGFSKSLGLSVVPRVRFIERYNARNNDNYLERKNKIVKFSDGESNVEEAESGDELDLFNVKNKDDEIAPLKLEELECLTVRKKSKKATSKVAIAKKVLRKNFVPNTKIVFNEEGEAISQSTREKQSQFARNYENDTTASGGINLDEAKMVLREEDKFDKTLFREKVKAKKKEQKKKLKAEKRRRDYDGSEEFSSNEEYEPDLSWLPDPDKLYGRVENAGETENTLSKGSTFNLSDGSDKMNVEVNVKTKVKSKMSSKSKISKLSEKLSVNEAEELAMLLLTEK